MSGSSFPNDFLWGAATSSYQIEGSPLSDGAGPSNWHLFSQQPGRIAGGDTGDVACDHYQRWREDIGYMQKLGLNAYRFSLAWNRIQPEGTGAINEHGLDFYERLVDGLLAAGIEPVPTLYHWDLPAKLDEQGGWANRDSADWFADYAEIVWRRLADRVGRWTTLNEPWVIVDAGYVHGVHAPGKQDLSLAPPASHNLLRAHGEAVRRYRSLSDGQIGIVVNIEPKDAASDTPEDLHATRLAEAYMNRQYLDPLLRGSYPTEMPEIFGENWPRFDDEDFSLIAQPLDFIGLNYYTRSVNRAETQASPVPAAQVRQPGAEYTELGWEVRAESLLQTLVWMKQRYGNPAIYITENGAAFDDPAPDSDGRVRDDRRAAYLLEHLRASREAIAQGVDLRGYFVWSLLDNLEWACGFSKRMGLIRVNFETQERTIKDSGHLYREIIESAGGRLDQEG